MPAPGGTFDKAERDIIAWSKERDLLCGGLNAGAGEECEDCAWVKASSDEEYIAEASTDQSHEASRQIEQYRSGKGSSHGE
jgi:hypothetical protein